MRFRTQLNRWQPSLGRFLQKYAYNSEDLASVGATLNVPSPSAEIASIEHPPPSAFFSLPPELRIRVVLFCCETQFHLNPLFKEKIKTMESPILRSRPFGSDIFGNTYWLLIDPEFNFLLYKGSASDETFSVRKCATCLFFFTKYSLVFNFSFFSPQYSLLATHLIISKLL